MLTHQITNSYGIHHYNAFIYRNIQFDFHFHNSYELIYVYAGTVKVVVNNTCYYLGKKELLLISPYSIHSLDIDNSSIVWVGVFSSDYIAEFHSKYARCSYSKFVCSSKNCEFLQNRLFFQGKPSDIFETKAYLYIVCSECLSNATITSGSESFNFAQKIILIIADKITEEITLCDLASSMGYEYHYFSSLFNRYFNMNYKSFLNLYRLEYSRELLSDKTKSISEVSIQSGFNSIRNYNRVFKQYYGMTPKEFRNN